MSSEKKCCFTCKGFAKESHGCAAHGDKTTVMHVGNAHVLYCDSYEKRKAPPLRLECECKWHELDVSFVPCGDNMGPLLRPFVGKKTKMTLEEIV